jgi:hypothetical protein
MHSFCYKTYASLKKVQNRSFISKTIDFSVISTRKKNNQFYGDPISNAEDFKR